MGLCLSLCSEGCAVKYQGWGTSGEEPVGHGLTSVSCACSAFPAEAPEQPAYPFAAAPEPSFLRPGQGFCRDRMFCAPLGKEEVGRVCPSWEGRDQGP